MDSVDVGYIITLDNSDFVVIDYIIKDNRKYVFLKGVDEEENLLDNQIIARVVIDEDNEWALEDIEDNFLMETLRNEFANRLRKEIDWNNFLFCAII